MKLTHKQRLFVDEYVKSGNATNAAIKAGYSERYAHTNVTKLLQNTTVKHYISTKMAEIESRKIADAKEAMQGITAIARGETKEIQASINPLTGQWEKTKVPADLKTRLNAWKEILKRYPLTDEMAKAQLKKTAAEARVAEARAKSMEDNGADVETLVTQLINTIRDEDKIESE